MSSSLLAAGRVADHARVGPALRANRVKARVNHGARWLSMAVAVLMLAAWGAASGFGLASPLFLPSPLRVARAAVMVAQHGYAGATLLQHVGASLFRVTAALAIAASLAIPFGLVMGLNRWVKAGLDPLIEFYWPLPPLSYLPLMIIWLGIGEVAKITLLTMAMFAPICLAAQSGVSSVPKARLHAAQCLGASRLQVFLHVVLPTALPEIFTGLRIAVGVGWGTLVAAELVAATQGIGFMIMSAANFLATDIVFIGIAAIAVLAIASSTLIRTAERLAVPWKGRG